jgi:hypothetical protein
MQRRQVFGYGNPLLARFPLRQAVELPLSDFMRLAGMGAKVWHRDLNAFLGIRILAARA